MGFLKPDEIERFFKDHLPYRTGILLAHYWMTRTSFTGNVHQLNACFIAALVSGRVFLNVLGVGKEAGQLVALKPATNPRPQGEDVRVEDLGGIPIDLGTMRDAEKKLLYDFIVMADKSAAHFTAEMKHPWERMDEAILCIHGYLKKNLYDYTGRPFKDAVPSKRYCTSFS